MGEGRACRSTGTPIRAGPSVYAYPSVVDAWREGRKVIPVPAPVKLFSRWPALAATLLLCVIMVGNGVRPVSAQQAAGTSGCICYMWCRT